MISWVTPLFGVLVQSCTKDLVNMTLTTTPLGNCESAMAVIFITVDIFSHSWCKQPLRSVWTLVGHVFNIWWKWVSSRLRIITNHCLIFHLFESHSWRKQPHSCSDRCGCECGPLATESCRWCRRPAGQVASPELPGASYGYTIWCTSWLVIVIVAPFWYNYATFGTLVAAVWC